MFCTNCGKQIIDTAKFCNYCGAVVAANMNNAAQPTAVPVNQPSAPVQEPQTAQAAEVKTEAAVPVEAAEATEAVKAEPVAAENTPVTAQPAVGMAVPQAVNSPKEGVAPAVQAVQATQPAQAVRPVQTVQTAQSVQTVQPMQTVTAASAPVPAPQNVPSTPAPKTEREPRMYTAGHIIMCLVSTAIMAIAAGIFAGLYFSVV